MRSESRLPRPLMAAAFNRVSFMSAQKEAFCSLAVIIRVPLQVQWWKESAMLGNLLHSLRRRSRLN